MGLPITINDLLVKCNMSNTMKSLLRLFRSSLVVIGLAAGSAPGTAPGDVYAFSENDVSFSISNGITANVTSRCTARIATS